MLRASGTDSRSTPDTRFDMSVRMADLDLKQHIRQIPDFPKPGILFYDLSTLLAHAGAWAETVHRLADVISPHKPDLLAGIESRGFLVAAPLAYSLGCGLIMLRKAGKLPGRTIGHEYALEYGTDCVEIQSDAVTPGQRVALVDDLLATGGTARASHDLLTKVGAEVVTAAFIMELTFLGGRKKLGLPVSTLISYDE